MYVCVRVKWAVSLRPPPPPISTSSLALCSPLLSCFFFLFSRLLDWFWCLLFIRPPVFPAYIWWFCSFPFIFVFALSPQCFRLSLPSVLFPILPQPPSLFSLASLSKSALPHHPLVLHSSSPTYLLNKPHLSWHSHPPPPPFFSPLSGCWYNPERGPHCLISVSTSAPESQLQAQAWMTSQALCPPTMTIVFCILPPPVSVFNESHHQTANNKSFNNT